jgi:hypothetical protein
MLLQILVKRVATTIEIMYDYSGRGKSSIQILIPSKFLITNTDSSSLLNLRPLMFRLTLADWLFSIYLRIFRRGIFSIYAHSFKNTPKASNEVLIYKESNRNQDEETVFLLVSCT